MEYVNEYLNEHTWKLVAGSDADPNLRVHVHQALD